MYPSPLIANQGFDIFLACTKQAVSNRRQLYFLATELIIDYFDVGIHARDIGLKSE